MAYPQNNQRKSLATQNGLTVWLKHKIVKNKKGEEREVFQSSVDIGGGKMVKLTIDARLYTVEAEKGHILPVYVSKWKSEQRPQNTNSKSW
jgi:hypothetical protein